MGSRRRLPRPDAILAGGMARGIRGRLGALSLCAALAGDAALAEPLPGAPPLPPALREALARELAARGPDYRPRTRQLEPDGSPRYTNRLLLEPSPYLQQHAHNPVDWHAWGDEAFALAERLGRPVLVSIGYSTCHWCHVMEAETFDDPDTARLLNEGFVAIKVDRETRPDVDSVYVAAAMAMNGQAGWPLNVWVTPEREPFYAGSYFPRRDEPGRLGFESVLAAISERHRADPDSLDAIAERLADALAQALASDVATATRVPDPGLLARAVEEFTRRADPEWGGIGTRKFPSSLPVRLLLRSHRRSGDERALALATLTLEKMAAGGIRDHLGGGFHRYATDPHWLVPHFEKMLTDNALLALAYLEAWQATGREEFAAIARETLASIAREWTAPGGGFASASDADSPAPGGGLEEGRYFTWTPGEIEAAVGADAAAAVAAWFGVSAQGPLAGRSVLHTARPLAEVARELGTTPAALARTLEAATAKLREARGRRPPPLRDDKIVTAWNGLAISAFARAGFALGEPDFVAAARRAAEFALGELWRGGRLARMHHAGRAVPPAFLEDYAFLVAALLDLYEVAPDPRWIREAIALQAAQDAHYADEGGGGYFLTADDQAPLIAREKPGEDGAIPSGNSVAALNLLRLHEYTLDPRYLERAVMLFSAFSESLESEPTSLPELLLALDYHHDAIKEVVVVRPEGGDAQALLAPLRTGFVPNRVLAVVTEGAELEAHARLVPLVQGRRAIRGEPTAYVCQDRVCRMPTSDPGVFARQLAEVTPLAPPEAP
jgi:uncharacterized protein YyaL (SSP411 family)